MRAVHSSRRDDASSFGLYLSCVNKNGATVTLRQNKLLIVSAHLWGIVFFDLTATLLRLMAFTISPI